MEWQAITVVIVFETMAGLTFLAALNRYRASDRGRDDLVHAGCTLALAVAFAAAPFFPAQTHAVPLTASPDSCEIQRDYLERALWEKKP